MNNSSNLLARLFVVLTIFAAGQSVAVGQTNYPVDLAAFQGVWHETARSPNLFQRDCQSTTAEYQLMADGRVQVINRCVTASGKTKSIEGSASSTNPPYNNRLIISLNAPFARRAERRGRVNYQIHYVSSDYQTAVVGTPRGRKVWILSRNPQLPVEQLNQLKCVANRAGYKTANLIEP